MSITNSTLTRKSRLPRSTKPIAKRSKRKRAAIVDAEALFREAAQERRIFVGCACEWPGCMRVGTDRHHALKRRFWNSVVPHLAWMLVRFFCREHHQWIEDHPEMARRNGYSYSRAEAVARGFTVERGQQ